MGVRKCRWRYRTDLRLPSYLLNKVAPAASERMRIALRIMLANEDELFALVSNPCFVNYSLYAMDPGQVYSVRVRGVDLLDVIRPQRSRKRLAILTRMEFGTTTRISLPTLEIIF